MGLATAAPVDSRKCTTNRVKTNVTSDLRL
jgi:hypothetical protein